MADGVAANAQTASHDRGSNVQSDRTALPRDARARQITRVALAIILLILGLWVARGFLNPLAWAAVITLAAWPIYERFKRAIGAPETGFVAPLVFTFLTGLILVLPVLFASLEIGREGQAIANYVKRLQENGIPAPNWAAQVPLAGDRFGEWWKSTLSDPQSAKELLGRLNLENLTNWTRAVGAELLHRLFMFAMSLFALFFFLRDGAWIGRRVLESADRLTGDPGERLASKMVDAVRGTVNGTVLVALGEGVIIGAGYFVAGVQSPMLFTILTAAFAMVPFGAWAAFSAASLLLLSNGDSGWAAALLFAWGAVVMLVGDNFVWPWLIGGAARLPFMLALVGIFGGVEAFGLLGLFLGPVVMAAVLTIWREWVAERPAEPG